MAANVLVLDQKEIDFIIMCLYTAGIQEYSIMHKYVERIVSFDPKDICEANLRHLLDELNPTPDMRDMILKVWKLVLNGVYGA